jgi:ABC-type multidrug transport system permease subunit
MLADAGPGHKPKLGGPLRDYQREVPNSLIKHAAGVVCIALASAITILLAISLVISILHKSFGPWWFWLAGVPTVGVLGIIAGLLLDQRED